MQTKLAFQVLAVTAALAAASVSKAQLQYRVSVDTRSLVGNPAGPYSLDFQLNDGSGVGDSNNHATLSNFQFGGGSAVGSGTTSGGAGGNLASTVWLTDSDPLLDEFYQGFTAGSWLSFDLTLTSNVDSGDTPDAFAFAILDGGLMNLPTQSLGSDSFVTINLDSVSPSIGTFASVDGLITASAVPVPEPSTYGLCGFASLALLGLCRRFRRR